MKYFLGDPCVVLCGIMLKTQKQKTEKSLFKKHSGFLDYCGRKPVKYSLLKKIITKKK